MDAQLGASVPASLITYRTLVENYAGAEGEEGALDKLAAMYEALKRYDLEAQILETLTMRYPNNSRDSSWRAAEINEKKLKDPGKARELYVLVPAQSPHYRDAQKKSGR